MVKYFNLAFDEVREKIIRIIKEHPSVSVRALGKMCNCSTATIHRYRLKLYETGEIARPETITGLDGKKHPTKKGAAPPK